MNIDEAAFERAFAGRGHEGRAMARQHIDRYLAALPSAEPGRDRIAVLVTKLGVVGISGQDGLINENYWRDLEDDAMTYFGAEPRECARVIVRCNLPRPAEPVEVEGSVEYPGIMSGPEPEGTKTWEQDMWGTIKP